MFPWLWFCNPQIHFPWSGSVSQDIHPETNWFTDNIKGKSGKADRADLERAAFAIASYGKQLGLITDVLITLAEQNATPSLQSSKSLNKLRDIKIAIDAMKKVQRDSNN